MHVKRRRHRRRYGRRYKRRMLRRMIRLIVLLGILIGIYFAGVKLEIFPDITKKNLDVSGEEYSLENNIEIIARVNNWAELSEKEKMEILSTVTKVECRYMGMHDSVPELKVSDLKDELKGMYEQQSDTITIDSAQFEGDDGYDNLQTLIHELTHRYQHYQIQMVKAVKSSMKTNQYASLMVFDSAEAYEKEMADYIEPEEDYEGYENQECERDAREYSLIATTAYCRRVQAYLGKAEN